MGLENYMLHTVQQNIEHFIWRDDAWIHSRSNHSRSSSLVHQTGNHATFWVWYWQFPLYYVGSTPPPRIPVTTRIVNIFDRESLQAICLKTTGWGVRSDVLFPMRDFPWTWREDPLLWTCGWPIGDSGDDFWEGNGDCQSCMISIPKCPIQGEVPMALESLGKPVVKPGWNHEIFWSQGKRSN